MLQGIFPVLPTPFRTDGAIDPDALLRVAEFAIAGGAAGLVFPGFASEVDELSASERGTLLRALAGAVAGRVPIIAGASSGNVDDAVARCREAMDLGVSTAMIQAPKSVGAGAGDVSAFYAAIARQMPGMEIILQNAPAPRGSDLSPDTILAIAGENAAIRYVKEETLPSGPAITRLVADRPATVAGILGGGGARYIIEEYRRGASGAMPAAEFADMHVALDADWRAGRESEARRIHELLLPLLVMQAFSRMRFTKHVLTRRGVLSNDVVRAKLPPLDSHEVAEIDTLLERLGDRLAAAPARRTA
jgi:4-hydroxy-tetrahydrodipicolinate synthase